MDRIKTCEQLCDDLRAAKMALTLAEHQAQQVATRPQPESTLSYARETADRAVSAARRACDDLRAARDTMSAASRTS